MEPAGHDAVILLEGHIIDSLVLPRVMDAVMDLGGNFSIEELEVGQHKTATSRCRMAITAPAPERLEAILERCRDLGAEVVEEEPARLARVSQEGVFPEGFYSTSNLATRVLLGGRWVDVEGQEMDCAIAVDEAAGRAWCIPFQDARPGLPVVVGRAGVRLLPVERSRRHEFFTFMTSEVSAEKPKKLVIREIANEMRAIRAEGGRILVVSGPAVVHTGSAGHLTRLIEGGYVQVLFAGNALAVHDVEAALFGTALGINLESGLPVEAGHANHMRAVNRVRAAGGIAAMVAGGELRSGVMKAALENGVEVVLAGSIRDDGPLPEVVTDVVAAQRAMRAALPGVRLALMVSTMLHSIATGNLLPASVRTVCVDMNPAVVTKLADRGTWQSVGLVTDVESFLRELASDLED
ncbi:MAG: TIGR00300 family protein [Candidatus Dormibacterales bacterium]